MGKSRNQRVGGSCARLGIFSSVYNYSRIGSIVSRKSMENL